MCPGEENSSLAMRVIWGGVIGMTGILFHVTGGFNAIKSVAVSGGIVFLLVMVAYLYSIVKMMHEDVTE